MKRIKKDSWILRWETFHPLYRIEALFLGHQKAPVLGSDYSKLLGFGDKNVVAMFYPKSDLNRKGNEGVKIFSNIKKMKKYFDIVARNHEDLIDGLRRLVARKHLISNEEFLESYKQIFNKLQILLCSYDLSRPEFFTKIEKIIKKHLKIQGLNDLKLIKTFGSLTASPYEHILDRERKDFLKIAIVAKRSRLNSERVKRSLNFHQIKYGWIGSSESDREWNLQYFKSILKKQVKLSKEQILKSLSEITENKKKLLVKQKYLENKFNFGRTLKTVLQVIRRLSEVRLKIRLQWVLSGYLTKKAFREITRRTGVNENDLSRYLLREIAALLIKGKKVKANEIGLRNQYAFMLYKSRVSFFVGANKVTKLRKKEIGEEIDYGRINDLRGKVANQGQVKGVVKIINALSKDQEKEIRLMRQGQILVTGMTRPHLIMAIRKASGIITDEGGITSHAAIIARELDIPCIIGTKIATKVLKNGDLVEVDANKGVVKILKRKKINYDKK